MLYDNNYLAHHGIKGQKWGVRRFQNVDGTYTLEGKKRLLEYLKQAGRNGTIAAKAHVRNRVKNFSARHKPVSQMSDEELKEYATRLQSEANVKRLQNELNNGHKEKRSFDQKHPIIKQVLVTTAVGVAAGLIRDQLNTKMDEVLAPKRKDRAEKSGILNKDMFPFLSTKNAARNSSYNKGKESEAKAEADILKRISEAVADSQKKAEPDIQKRIADAVAEATKKKKYYKVAKGTNRPVNSGIKLAWDGLKKNLNTVSVDSIKLRQGPGGEGLALIEKALSRNKKG